MTDEPEQQPVIIKKVKKDHGGHGGAWKVAYADFVTAMMALFIVLWVMGQDEDVLEAVASYFKDPIGFSNKSGTYWDGRNKNLITPGTLDEKMHLEAEKKKLEKMSAELISELETDEEFRELLDQIEVKIVKEGLRIELIDSEKDLFFEIGTPKLNSKAGDFLKKIGSKLAKLPNKIVVEGHTDSRPYTGNGAGYSNFELSTERANSARRALILGGMLDNQFEEVRGYADRILKDPDDPFNAINRRISIIIKYVSADLKPTPLSEINGLEEP